MVRKQFTITDPVERAFVLKDLALVGPTKAIGYLLMRTVTRILQADLGELIATAEAKGVSAIAFHAKDCCIRGGALYLYHRPTLTALLNASTHVLSPSNIPSEPDAFVRHIAAHWLEPGHPVRPIIDAAFADEVTAEIPAPS